MNETRASDSRRESDRFVLCVYKEKRESVFALLYGSELL